MIQDTTTRSRMIPKKHIMDKGTIPMTTVHWGGRKSNSHPQVSSPPRRSYNPQSCNSNRYGDYEDHNVPGELNKVISIIVGIGNQGLSGNYLGLPCSIGQNKRQVLG